MSTCGDLKKLPGQSVLACQMVDDWSRGRIQSISFATVTFQQSVEEAQIPSIGRDHFDDSKVLFDEGGSSDHRIVILLLPKEI